MIRVEKVDICKGGRTILADINMKIEEGDHILIKGPSGAGKSTLLKALLFFERLEQGRVFFRDEEISHHNLDKYRKYFAYIGQKAPHYDGVVEEFLQLPFTFKSNSDLKLPSSDKIDSLCKLFSFPESPLKRNYNSLSGGEQQRISIIQALLLDKPVYLLDEITASLDPANSEKVVEHLCEMKEKTLVIVSHDREWEEAVGRSVTIADKTLAENGK